MLVGVVLLPVDVVVGGLGVRGGDSQGGGGSGERDDDEVLRMVSSVTLLVVWREDEKVDGYTAADLTAT